MRFINREAALEFVRGFLGDTYALTGLRRLLARSRNDVSRLTDDDVLREIATLLTCGSVPVAGSVLMRVTIDEPEKKPKEAKSSHGPPAPAPSDDEETYILAISVKTIGGTPLLNHPVRVLDPATGQTVVSALMTDGAGVVRTRVPENKTYRIEILDEKRPTPLLPPPPSDEEHAVLVCHFVDEAGHPIAEEKVEVANGQDRFDLLTDEDGLIRCPAHLTAYDVTIRKQRFIAHSLLYSDRKDDDDLDNLYRFVVSEGSA
jgi:hypothetical protein